MRIEYQVVSCINPGPLPSPPPSPVTPKIALLGVLLTFMSNTV